MTELLEFIKNILFLPFKLDIVIYFILPFTIVAIIFKFIYSFAGIYNE